MNSHFKTDVDVMGIHCIHEKDKGPNPKLKQRVGQLVANLSYD